MLRESKTIQMAHDSAVKKNDVVLKDGDFAMVALNDAEANELIAYGVEGSFEFKKDSGASLKVGDKAYYKVAEKSITNTASGNKFIGRVVQVGTSTIEVKINTK